MTGNNITYLQVKYDKTHLKDLVNEKSRIRNARVNLIAENEEWKVNLIQEISLLLKEQLEIEFDNFHLEEMLRFVCTD